MILDTGSSSSEEEGPNRPTSGPSARNGEVRRRRSRTPSPRRRHRDVSPRSEKLHKSTQHKNSAPFSSTSQTANLSFLFCVSRKRRSPSPGRRRRTPSPPRRRRSPSPRRRYGFVHRAARISSHNALDLTDFEFQVSFSTASSSFPITEALLSPHPAPLQPLPFAAAEEEDVQLPCQAFPSQATALQVS